MRDKRPVGHQPSTINHSPSPPHPLISFAFLRIFVSLWFKQGEGLMKPAPVCPLFIGGEWRSFEAAESAPVYNPSDGTVIARVPLCGAGEVARAVEAARAALPEWAETPAVERARVMFRYRALLEEHLEELARLVTREHGKTLAEARG